MCMQLFELQHYENHVTKKYANTNSSGDTSTENSRREKRKRQEEPGKSSAIIEVFGDQNSVALPRLEISASGLPKEHNCSSSPIILSDSSPDTPQATT
jgi:hypothetical protein